MKKETGNEGRGGSPEKKDFPFFGFGAILYATKWRIALF